MADGFVTETLEDGTVVLVNYKANVQDVVIPEDVDVIGPRVFFSASKMESLTLNERVREIPVDSFCYNIAFLNFIVPEANPYFSARNGILYSKDGSVMLNYPPARKDSEYVMEEGLLSMRQSFRYGPRFLFSITTPSTFAELPDDAFRCSFTVNTITVKDGPKRVGKRCFSFSTDLKNIILPSTLEVIDDEAFRGLTSLEHIDIPASVKSIGSKAFTGCPLLCEITIPAACKIEDDSFDSTTKVNRA